MNACAHALRQRLAGAGGWISRPDLDHDLGYSISRVDDELADMVAAGTVLYNTRSRQYRLAGTPLALSALKRLVAGGAELKAAVVARPSADATAFQVGVARRLPAADGTEQLVMCELALDKPTEPADTALLGMQLVALVDRHAAAWEGAAS